MHFNQKDLFLDGIKGFISILKKDFHKLLKMILNQQ